MRDFIVIPFSKMKTEDPDSKVEMRKVQPGKIHIPFRRLRAPFSSLYVGFSALNPQETSTPRVLTIF
jgi:hypothetical protein